jgi:hypothetical protein
MGGRDERAAGQARGIEALPDLSEEEPSAPSAQPVKEEIAWDFEGARRHHLRLGLKMTPAERLRWLEETVDEMRRLQGLARRAERSEM